jgi:hypothetical protein
MGVQPPDRSTASTREAEIRATRIVGCRPGSELVTVPASALADGGTERVMAGGVAWVSGVSMSTCRRLVVSWAGGRLQQQSGVT